ncbi:cytochrome c oxidase assembly protein [Pontibacter sp. JAM-7]|uniref:cytochrome c oxidase assembly protein n=1 Tax=Pontibacter sp. JAM-7 TaxID=3366581 RepID=UPI003AF8E787
MDSKQQARTKRTLFYSLFGCLAMFGFGFALVPLYDVFCDITGLNGKVELQAVAAPLPGQIDRSREVKLQLTAVNNEAMPWGFRPAQAQTRLHPGQLLQTAYIAHNPTGRYMIAQAIPSVSPSEAAPYVQKVNCFCFDRQPLSAAEQKEMPLLLSISPELPAHIHTITLSYTLFDITPAADNRVAAGGRNGL